MADVAAIPASGPLSARGQYALGLALMVSGAGGISGMSHECAPARHGCQGSLLVKTLPSPGFHGTDSQGLFGRNPVTRNRVLCLGQAPLTLAAGGGAHPVMKRILDAVLRIGDTACLNPQIAEVISPSQSSATRWSSSPDTSPWP